MIVQEFYHGAVGDNILSIIQEGVLRPTNGEIYFIKLESQLADGFQYGADVSRSAAFVIKVKAQIPDGLSPKRVIRPGAPQDAWKYQISQPLKVEVLKLYVRSKPGMPLEVKNGAPAIKAYLLATKE